jgi:hypothetical protein
MTDKTKSSPVHKIRPGAVELAIWKNDGDMPAPRIATASGGRRPWILSGDGFPPSGRRLLEARRPHEAAGTPRARRREPRGVV